MHLQEQKMNKSPHGHKHVTVSLQARMVRFIQAWPLWLGQVDLHLPEQDLTQIATSMFCEHYKSAHVNSQNEKYQRK